MAEMADQVREIRGSGGIKRFLKIKIRSENLILAETIPDYFERIASLLWRNYPKSLSIIRICSRMLCFFRQYLNRGVNNSA
ncbi:hypothetical protein PEDI_38760 [Persicobacter diffluens]|uniref:Uncharacterized protein n=1 Tax=Persicobacter diffluens TaxID=981 RepID=A0AAN5ALJ8_9BACT|nr:hypothetical protein PEDI_38760 [Persicobacter diffluens]